MKKLLSILIVLLLVTSPIFAAKYTLCCGVTVTSHDQDAFETLGEWMDWVKILNEINCGIPVQEQDYIYVDETIGSNWFYVNC